MAIINASTAFRAFEYATYNMSFHTSSATNATEIPEGLYDLEVTISTKPKSMSTNEDYQVLVDILVYTNAGALINTYNSVRGDFSTNSLRELLYPTAGSYANYSMYHGRSFSVPEGHYIKVKVVTLDNASYNTTADDSASGSQVSRANSYIDTFCTITRRG